MELSDNLKGRYWKEKTIVHVCVSRIWGWWRKCVKYECHLCLKNVECLYENCLRLLLRLWYILYTHTHPPIHSLNRTNGPINFIVVGTRIRVVYLPNIIDTFQIQSKLFQYFFLLIFDPSSFICIQIKYQNLSHNGIKYKLLIYWKWYTNTSYQPV